MRVYKRVLGSRTYANYSNDSLNEAVGKIKSGELSQKAASKQYNIPRGTLQNKLNLKFNKKTGGQFIFSPVEEQCFVDHLLLVSKWGYPLNCKDLCMIVKEYLDSRGRKIKKFGNSNCPSYDWAKSFCSRHKEVTIRMASNIKPSRASICSNDIKRYFDHLEVELQGIPPKNIVNYDETNLSDDPGRTMCIFKRGIKYAERVMHFTKASISIMFSGSASGHMLPPYVVYKADHLYNTWTEGGPPQARYNRSKSGWFDKTTFTDWFIQIVLPYFKKCEGVKAIIGDNLSSHFTDEVLKLCVSNNIKFICLPPNTTHLTQPLDIAYYGPLKRLWKGILTKYKLSHVRKQNVTKDAFPSLLKLLCEQLKYENIIAGFNKAGIFPLDRSKVLDRIPDSESSTTISNSVSQIIIHHLKEMRNSDDIPVKRKRFRLDVQAGKSVANLLPNESVDPETSNNASVDSQNCDEVETAINNQGSLDMEESNKVLSGKTWVVGNYVLVRFSTSSNSYRYYVGQIVDFLDNSGPGSSKRISQLTDGYRIQFLKKVGDHFIWPAKEDKSDVPATDIIKLLPSPTINKRGIIVFNFSFSGYTVF